jgi:hypothetical protein
MTVTAIGTQPPLPWPLGVAVSVGFKLATTNKGFTTRPPEEGKYREWAMGHVT